MTDNEMNPAAQPLANEEESDDEGWGPDGEVELKSVQSPAGTVWTC